MLRKKSILQLKYLTMIRQFTFCMLLFLPTCLLAQNFSGQWKGSFDETRDPSRTEYVLEIEVKGNSFEGISITYFNINGKRCYTMCAVKGTIDPGSKTLTSTEISKIKANTPDWFLDCFQTHTLTFYKKGDEEQLVGTWKSARKTDNCGTGKTTLSRKIITTSAKKATPVQQQKNTNPKTNSGTTAKKDPVNTADDKDKTSGSISSDKDEPKTSAHIKADNKIIAQPKLEKRENKIFETITLEAETIEVSLFDNAEIDGDIITLLFNGEVVLSKQTLSDKPITVKLKMVSGKENILTMYAENQGRIPPNTAIMRIKNEETYHKILLSADDKNNGSVILKLK